MKKTLILQEKSFHLESKMHRFISDYLQRMENFVCKHQIEAELHQDILQLLTEKLEALESKDQLDSTHIVQIINELWEAEDIFAEEIADEKHTLESSKKDEKADLPSESSHFYEKLQSTQRTRPQEKAIFLGVCAMFAQWSGQSVWVRRGITLFVSWFLLAGGIFELFGLGTQLYLLLALIFPITGKDYAQRSVFSYFLTQARDLRLAISNGVRFARNFTKRGLAFARKVLNKLISRFWPLMRYVVLCFVSLGLLVLTALCGSLLYILITGFSVQNMELTSVVPAITPRGVGLGLFAVVSLLVMSIGGLFKMKLFTKASIILTIVSGACAIAIGGISLAQMYQLIMSMDNSRPQLVIKQVELPLTEIQGTPLIEVWESASQQERPRSVIDTHKLINIIPYQGDKLIAEYRFELHGFQTEQGQRNLQEAINNLSELEVSQEDGQITFWPQNQLYLSKKSAFVPLNVDVRLYVPEQLTFNLSPRNRWGGVHYPKWILENWGYRHLPCDVAIRYESKENHFFCDQEPTFWQKRYYIKNQIKRKADTLTPFIGSQRKYSYNPSSEGAYWRVHSIDWKDEHTVVVKLSDQFFNLFVEVNYRLESHEKELELQLNNPRLIEVEQKGVMNSERESYYQGREALSGFKVEFSERPEDLRKKIAELEQKLKKLEAGEQEAESEE